MTVEEIFSQISDHMIQGIMTHSQLSDYYNFLGLKGYAKCHEYHFISENCNFRKLSWYYLKHFNKLIPELQTPNPNIIPQSWLKYKRQDVDASTRKSAIAAGIEKWVAWETNTKAFYQNMFQELITIGEVAAAMELKFFLLDVDEELATAQQKHIEQKSIDYDITSIISVQEDIYQKYKKKIKNFYD